MPEFLDQIFVSGVDRDRQVRWNSPRGGGPDGNRALSREWSGPNRERDIDRRICPLLVFDFGFCQCGLCAGAPKNWFFALVNQILFHQFGKNAKNDRFVGRIKGQVGMFPISKDAEPPKLTPLNIDVFAGIGLGSFAHFQRRKSLRFFDDFELDRQSMTIPAGDVGRSETGHRPAFHDQVLQYFIERGAHVDIAIGKRRTVVQNEKGIVFSRFLNLLVDFFRVPSG